MLDTIADALQLERAAWFVRGPDDPHYQPVAVVGSPRPEAFPVGDAPGAGPWSSVLPVQVAGQPLGMLLLALPDGAPLSPLLEQRAKRLADGLGRLDGHGRMQAELARTGTLLARTDRLSGLGTLAAGVVHEIRNPLVSVRTFLQLLPERRDGQG